ncbi:MAG: AmmeMemoRadiSam system radical SAM enzyme, partial [Calditrichaeota bacterium]
MIKEARYYEQKEADKVHCHLCPAECLLKEGQQGICINRYNQNGKLYTDNYAQVVTIAVDP